MTTETIILKTNDFFKILQDETRAFKRQLEDKRAIIENNLLTGRQHLQQAGSSLSLIHI